MRPQATLGWKDGWLCAVEVTVRHTEPVQDTTYWPLGRCSHAEWADDLGKPLYAEGLYTYSLKIGGFWKTFTLVDGGKTHSIAVESQPVPKPKRVRAALRWHAGRWQKYDRRQGWIIA